MRNETKTCREWKLKTEIQRPISTAIMKMILLPAT